MVRRLLWVPLVLGFLCLVRMGWAEPPLDPKAVPAPLRDWVPWVLDGVTHCPVLYDKANDERCSWPSRLNLSIGDKGGTFTQSWHVDATALVPLPGDSKRWPHDLRIDGPPALVVTSGSAPMVELAPGDHVVSGSFAWDSLPASLTVPKDTALLSLTVRGTKVLTPSIDAQGNVWLEKQATSEEGDALGIVVHREVIDDIPLQVDTRIELHVSGKSREEVLGKAVLPGFIPLSLSSPLPARVEPDGRIRVQLRPGMFVLELVARAPGPVTSLTRPAPEGPWKQGEEVWAFQARNDYRVVSVVGVSSIDPQQTTLPDAWKRLPTYPMPVGATMRFVDKRRGDADPPPDQLTLTRELWLDFDGGGYTVHDSIVGTLSRELRLTMNPPTVLGRVAIGDKDQFITTLGDQGTPRAGVEVRQGRLDVSADSRVVTGNAGDIPAVGWAHDFHAVSGKVNLPPGWRLVYATGVDEVPETWIHGWSLLELFLALIVGIAVARLFTPAWGAVALAMMILTLPETDAPEWSWVVLLAVTALVRFIPTGRLRSLFVGGQVAAFLFIVVAVLPFAVDQVRQGVYPVLAQPGFVGGSEPIAPMGHATGGAVAAKSVAAPASPPAERAPCNCTPGDPLCSCLDNLADAKKNVIAAQASQQILRSQAQGDIPPQKVAGSWSRGASSFSAGDESYLANSQTYDPSAVVQTGPGLPRWRWAQADLRWSGPVASTQRLHLFLLSPRANLLLALLRAALLLIVLLRLMPGSARVMPRVFGGSALAALLFLPGVARADLPDKGVLDDLRGRLLRAPLCTPTCASTDRLALEVRGGMLRARMHLDAAAPVAVPLPSGGAAWSASNVIVDGTPARALLREGDVLWVAVDKGSHEILVEGALPDRASMQLALPLKPHRVEVTAEGWTVAGVHEDGLADDDLQLTRLEVKGRGAGESLQPGALPPFVSITRTLHIGLDWQIDTHLRRLSPTGSAVVLEVPLLPGENVTTPDVRVVSGKALVNLGPDVTDVSWHGTLEQRSPIKLAAPKRTEWVEIWRLDVGPIWHPMYGGIPFVHTSDAAGTKVPEWRPWPGEEATVSLVRPSGTSGQSLTIDESETTLSPGLRSVDVKVAVSLRSSRGGDETVTLPDGAELESLSLGGAPEPIRQDGRRVTVTTSPGAHYLELTFRMALDMGLSFTSPVVDIGAPSVNAAVRLDVPGSRWLLYAWGPHVGPAVLFWSLLFVLAIAAWLLGKNRWTPLRGWHWMLLGIGLSQLDVWAGAFFVGWLLALGWRGREDVAPSRLTPFWFDVRQLVLALWTGGALIVLWLALKQGLLGMPEMQVAGNGSSSSLLRWFSDRVGPGLPRVRVLWVPLLVYRVAMLAWALWIVLALLSWLRWGWGAFMRGGGWRRRPPKPPFGPPVYAAPPVGSMPQGPVAPMASPPDEPKVP